MQISSILSLKTYRRKLIMIFISLLLIIKKALGPLGYIYTDSLHVETPSLSLSQIDQPSKTQVASDIAHMFDILSWYSPVVVYAKISM